MKIDNRPSWVPRAEAALERGRTAYKEAAEIIIAARAADPTLTMESVGQHLGHGKHWVSNLLAWHADGCDPRGPFSKYVPPGEQAKKARKPSQFTHTARPGRDEHPAQLELNVSGEYRPTAERRNGLLRRRIADRRKAAQ